MVPKLSDACHAVWIMFMISNIDTPWMIYFASFCSAIKYEGNSTDTTTSIIYFKKRKRKKKRQNYGWYWI
jgi:hypothetical protein